MQRLIAILALICVAPLSQAALLDFQFSFDDLENGTSVTGIIRGLMDNASGPASSVEVLASTGGFGIGEFIGDPLLNDFRVYNGELEEAVFRSLGSVNTTGVMDASLLFDIDLYALCLTLPCPQVMSGALSPFANAIDIDHDSIV
ncbi:MAG: hypothetical protein HKN19_17825, partial [Halioglobus sp.]|nr:hypothetical protein [Halioglobus sp.]